MVSLTLTPLAPWQAAQTSSTFALPAAGSPCWAAACVAGASASTTDTAIVFFMRFSL